MAIFYNQKQKKVANKEKFLYIGFPNFVIKWK